VIIFSGREENGLMGRRYAVNSRMQADHKHWQSPARVQEHKKKMTTCISKKLALDTRLQSL
jgi:hypothetical protein